ncbi:DUF6223 family protein [Glycomyces xiaoerkulensis]|uniref:DUF6223 family protein n=1 Tax=Glycomyces xiaoerkulensis TaxID=2038139 RepID=UPI000C260D1D|nr:DUF6223 family protein [Glycomyces xiaoerkulensis]
MTARHLSTIATTAIAGVLLLAAPAAAHDQVAVGGYGPDSDRFGAVVAAALGLTSVAIGALAYLRAAGRIRIGSAPAAAIAALALGLTGFVLAVLHEAQSTGGFGTGNGRAGAIVALVVALIGMNLGGLALARTLRSPMSRSR